MKVDISNLLKYNGNAMKVDLYATPHLFVDVDFDADITEQVYLTGNLENLSGTLSFKGTLSFSYKGLCARCLENIEQSECIDVEGIFSNEESDEQKEDYSYTGRELDFSRFMIDNVLLSIPLKHLCDDSCKGLCLHCGKNLNQENCSCKIENIDPRMSKLKDLFK
jgi:uncharacterized protein